MSEFSTHLNRSRRVVRTTLYIDMVIFAIGIVVELAYIIVLTKALAETQDWLLILVIDPWLLVLCCLYVLFVLPILQRPFVRIRLTPEGVWLHRPLCREKLIPWGAFQEVCLIDDDIAIGDRQLPASVLLVKWEAPKRSNGQWNINSSTHPYRIISIDFDAEVHAAVRALCPHCIVDYRKNLNGKHCATT